MTIKDDTHTNTLYTITANTYSDTNTHTNTLYTITTITYPDTNAHTNTNTGSANANYNQ